MHTDAASEKFFRMERVKSVSTAAKVHPTQVELLPPRKQKSMFNEAVSRFWPSNNVRSDVHLAPPSQRYEALLWRSCLPSCVIL